MKLSILILSLESRSHLLSRLINELEKQISENQLSDKVETLTYVDSGEKTIGSKRNYLKSIANGEYIVFIDDDDMVSEDYLTQILKAINGGYDLINFFVEKYIDNKIQETLICPNPTIDGIQIQNIFFWTNLLHICPHKRILANQIEFPNINNWEDLEYSRKLSCLITSQFKVEKILYYYFYQSK